MLVNKDPTSYKASFSSSSKGGKLMWKTSEQNHSAQSQMDNLWKLLKYKRAKPSLKMKCIALTLDFIFQQDFSACVLQDGDKLNMTDSLLIKRYKLYVGNNYILLFTRSTVRARSLVVSDLRSETKGSRFDSSY